MNLIEHGASQCSIFSYSTAPMERVDYVSDGQRGLEKPYNNTYKLGFSFNNHHHKRKISAKEVIVRFMMNTNAKFEAVSATLSNA